MGLVIKNGTVVTARDIYRADVAIEKDVISAIGADIKPDGNEVIDASGMQVLPGMVDPHTHLDFPMAGTVTADDWETGTKAAAFGGTTTIIDFAIQSKGETWSQTINTWNSRAEGKAVIDYGYHLAVTDMPDAVLAEMGDMVAAGINTWKGFMSGGLMVDDTVLFRCLLEGKKYNALIGAHAENGHVINVLTTNYLAAGQTGPEYFELCRPPKTEGEATARAVALAEMAKAPFYIFHLSCQDALEPVVAARQKGERIYAETCPQYLFLTRECYNTPGWEPAKYVCAPPIRSQENQDAMWRALNNGSLQVVSSDHCPFNFAGLGSKELGRDDFNKIPTGTPGIETRVPLMYTAVANGRISLNRFVDVCATAPAKIFGLFPKKGTIAVGSDADIVILDPKAEYKITAKELHQRVDYTAYEGTTAKGRIETVLVRGKAVIKDRRFVGELGTGEYLKRGEPILD